MDLEQRLARLERANRRMKRIGALVLLMAAVVLLSGQAKGNDLQDLVVGSLTLKDKDGKTRARLRALADGSVALALFDKDGNARAMLFVAADGSPDLTLSDKAGKTRAHLVVGVDGSPVLALSDKDGKVRASLYVGVASSGPGWPHTGSPGLDLYDKDGQTRATLGVSMVDRLLAPVRTEGTLTLFDAKGNVLWQEPREGR